MGANLVFISVENKPKMKRIFTIKSPYYQGENLQIINATGRVILNNFTLPAGIIKTISKLAAAAEELHAVGGGDKGDGAAGGGDKKGVAGADVLPVHKAGAGYAYYD